jgi:hypothetical protein
MVKREVPVTRVVEGTSVEPAGGPVAPIIFFDNVTAFGMINGVANLTLEAFIQVAGDKVSSRRVVVAHLRFGKSSLKNVAEALEKLKLLASVTGQMQ